MWVEKNSGKWICFAIVSVFLINLMHIYTFLIIYDVYIIYIYKDNSHDCLRTNPKTRNFWHKVTRIRRTRGGGVGGLLLNLYAKLDFINVCMSLGKKAWNVCVYNLYIYVYIRKTYVDRKTTNTTLLVAAAGHLTRYMCTWTETLLGRPT